MRLDYLLMLFFCLSSSTIFSQGTTPPPHAISDDQCRIAFYTRDSIAIQFPEAKPKYESIAKSHEKLHAIREQQVPAMDRLLTTNSEAAKKEVAALNKDSLAEEQNIVKQYQLLQPTYKKVDLVADSIGKARGVKQTRESADNSEMICPTDQMLMIDITNDIARAMGVKPKLAKIGIYNMDSLLRTMPGYLVYADSIKTERSHFALTLSGKYEPIAEKQHELDSLRPTLSKKQITKREEEIAKLQDEYDTYRGNTLYALDIKDSARVSTYKMKFYKALKEVHLSAGCYRSYEYADAHALWKPEEAEFIDLNVAISKKISRL